MQQKSRIESSFMPKKGQWYKHPRIEIREVGLKEYPVSLSTVERLSMPRSEVPAPAHPMHRAVALIGTEKGKWSEYCREVRRYHQTGRVQASQRAPRCLRFFLGAGMCICERDVLCESERSLDAPILPETALTNSSLSLHLAPIGKIEKRSQSLTSGKMGVPGLFRWLTRFAPAAVRDTLPTEIDELDVDFPSIVYGAVAVTYGLTDLATLSNVLDPETKQEFLEEQLLKESVDRTSKMAKNFTRGTIGTFFVALDGMPVYAKVLQQRLRRWMHAEAVDEERRTIEDLAERLMGKKKAEAIGMVNETLRHIKGTGREDMKIATIFIRYVVEGKKGKSGVAGMRERLSRLSWHGRIMLNTNAITPGSEFMRRLSERIKESIEFNYTSWPVVRAMFSPESVPDEAEHKIMDHLRSGSAQSTLRPRVISSPDADMVLLALVNDLPNTFIVRKLHDGYRPARRQIIDIDALRDRIVRDVTPRATFHSEFIFALSVLGNDFVPALVESFDFSEMADVLLDSVKRHPVLNDEDDVVWAGFGSVLRALDTKTWRGQTALQRRAKDVPFYLLEQFSETKQVDGVARELIDYEAFRVAWYWRAIGILPEDEDRKERVLTALGIDEGTFISRMVDTLTHDYLNGLQFVLSYYKRGTAGVSGTWGYEHHYPPLLKDLIAKVGAISRGEAAKPDDWRRTGPNTYRNQLYQLLSVIPKKDVDILPEKVRAAVEGELRAFFPDTFMYGRDYRLMSFEDVAWLPFPTPERIMKFVDEKILPQLSESEFEMYSPGKDLLLATKQDTRSNRPRTTGRPQRGGAVERGRGDRDGGGRGRDDRGGGRGRDDRGGGRGRGDRGGRGGRGRDDRGGGRGRDDRGGRGGRGRSPYGGPRGGRGGGSSSYGGSRGGRGRGGRGGRDMR